MSQHRRSNLPLARVVVLSALLALALPGDARAGELGIDLGRGPVTVHIPDSYDPAVPTPLVVLLHGYGGSGAGQESYMQLLPLSEQLGFVYAHPDGTVDLTGFPFWNATDACCNFFASAVDDAGYLRDLVEEIQDQLNVDPRRVHFAGHSNGGFMCYRMACEYPQVIASIASLAGATFFTPGDCAQASPVHVLQIHGTADETIFYGGGDIFGNAYPSAVETVEQRAGVAGCSLVPDTSAPPINLDSGIPGPETTVTRYESACDAAGSAELWTIVGGSHVPGLSGSFSSRMVQFLLDHPKPALGTPYCVAAPNSVGPGASISGMGTDVVASDGFTLLADGLPSGVFGLFYFGPNQIRVPFGDGFRCVGGVTARLQPPAQTSAFGTAARTVDLNAPPAAGIVAPGVVSNFQLWYRDVPGGPSGFNLSDGLQVAWQ